MSETMGKKLRKLREKEGIKQCEAANELGITKSAMCAYENDNRRPTDDALVKLVEYYHVSADYLLGIQDPNVIYLNELSERDAKILKELFNNMKE